MDTLSRRRFSLTLCGVPFASPLLGQPTKRMPWDEPAVVARVYLAAPQPHWPKPTLDIPQEAADIEARLVEVQRRNSDNVRLIGGELLRRAEDYRPWLSKMGDIDGVLIIPLTQPTVALPALLDALSVPALFFSRPYATHAWSSIADLRKAGRKIDVVASSSYGDLDSCLRMFRTARHLRRSKVLVGCENAAARKATTEAYTKQFGTAFEFVSGSELVAAFNAADPKAAQREAGAVVKDALRVVEPAPKEIHDAMRFYLALATMLKDRQANAFTIDCFGTLAANKLPGYPCIAWSKFNDAGAYGVCEADLASTMTQMLVTSYAGVPGFVSDPVFDISRNEVIHAHCVSARKMRGFDKPAAPYLLRNHLETNEGATMQVMMPAGETITVARFAGPAKFLVSTAEVTGAVDSDRGCRTQIRTRVSNAEKWLQSFTAGLHRVIFYGDHVSAIERMGRLMGFEVIREI